MSPDRYTSIEVSKSRAMVLDLTGGEKGETIPASGQMDKEDAVIFAGVLNALERAHKTIGQLRSELAKKGGRK